VTDRSALAGLTIEAARRELARQFKDAGIDTPDIDARLLVGAALNLDLTAIVTKADTVLSAADAAALQSLAQRRAAHEPVARIVGEKEFWGLRLKLSPDTLVPRPDTETVVAAALDFVRASQPPRRQLRIADIGTGSGAILLALLSELPDAIGVGTDIAAGALTVARANADQLGLANRATFAAGDYLSALEGRFDLIVSNPPYIRTADLASLAPEVRDHEPRRALEGGPDGLAAYRALSSESSIHLQPGGALIVEVGHDQADDVALIMEAAGLEPRRPFRPDLAGIQRVVEGRKTGR